VREKIEGGDLGNQVLRDRGVGQGGDPGESTSPPQWYVFQAWCMVWWGHAVVLIVWCHAFPRGRGGEEGRRMVGGGGVSECSQLSRRKGERHAEGGEFPGLAVAIGYHPKKSNAVYQ